MNKIIQGDSLEVLKEFDADSVDLLCTDPPYGYSFMGKSWDKALPDIGIFKECLRVLKPGAFAFVMSAPRSDVCARMMLLLEDAGFNIGFTPIYWTYASGFPKAMNIGKMVDKRMGIEVKEGTGFKTAGEYGGRDLVDPTPQGEAREAMRHTVQSEAGKALDGSYGGFQPKPAVEVIIVAMKPLSEKTFVDQALKNGKGITWLDDARIPGAVTTNPLVRNAAGFQSDGLADQGATGKGTDSAGRFPANLLVSDDVLNDGVERKGSATTKVGKVYGENRGTSYLQEKAHGVNINDSGSYSRYFDLDAWYNYRNESIENNDTHPSGTSGCGLPSEVAKTLPFLIVPKASKREKNEGLEHLPEKEMAHSTNMKCANCDLPVLSGTGETCQCEEKSEVHQKARNFHPTVKPLKLMQYLITLGSRPGDIVLDPFAGSGTTGVAAKQLNRNYILIEREKEYVDIAEARMKTIQDTLFAAVDTPPITQPI